MLREGRTNLCRIRLVTVVQPGFPDSKIYLVGWFGCGGLRGRSRRWDVIQIKVISHVITYCELALLLTRDFLNIVHICDGEIAFAQFRVCKHLH